MPQDGLDPPDPPQHLPPPGHQTRLWPTSARGWGIVVGLVNAGDRHRPTWGWGRAGLGSKVNSPILAWGGFWEQFEVMRIFGVEGEDGPFGVMGRAVMFPGEGEAVVVADGGEGGEEVIGDDESGLVGVGEREEGLGFDGFHGLQK